MSKKEKNDWEPCPKGVVSETSSSLRLLRRRGFLVRALLSAGATLAGGGALIGYELVRDQTPNIPPIFPVPDPLPGKISCQTVMELMPAYVSGQLCQSEMKKISTHITMCHFCAKRIEEHFESGKCTAETTNRYVRI